MTKRDNRERVISEAEQRLLMSYVDGDVSWFGRLRAERLLSSNQAAGEFLAALHETRRAMAEVVDAHAERCPRDMWQRIEQRIVGEERAALYLGERRRVREPVSLRRVWNRWMVPGLVGSAVTASAMLSLAPVRAGLVQNGSGTSVASLQSGSVGSVTRPVVMQRVYPGGGVARGLSPEEDTPRIIEPVEVDWMRSSGRLQMVSSGPQGRGGIIWVRTKPKRSGAPVVDAPSRELVGRAAGDIQR